MPKGVSRILEQPFFFEFIESFRRHALLLESGAIAGGLVSGTIIKVFELSVEKFELGVGNRVFVDIEPDQVDVSRNK